MLDEDALARALGGVNGVLITPYRDGNSSVDDEELRRIAERAQRSGVHSLSVLGNTAEPFQLTEAEQSLVLEVAISARSDVPFLAGATGSYSRVVHLSEHCRGLGYAAMLLHEPTDPFAAEDGLIEYIRGLACDSALPLVLYVRSKRISPEGLGEIVQHPRIVGVKYARSDLVDLAALLSSDKSRNACTWICGLAEAYFPGFAALGVTGFTSGLANLRPDLAVSLWAAVERSSWPEFARLYNLIVPFETLRNADGGRLNVAIVKEGLRMIGEEAGDVRPPYALLNQCERASLAAVVQSWPTVGAEL